jgi:pimeloyl-ACP methyl ester carboxylesterase
MQCIELTVADQLCHIAIGDQAFDPVRAKAPPIVLVHGAANDSDVWQKIARALTAAGHTVLVPDLPGHGRSSGEVLNRIEALADWLIAVLNAAGLERVVLVGHSMGSLIVLEAAARYAQRVSRIVLLGASAPMPVSDFLLNVAQNNPDSACRLIAQFSHTPQFYLTGGAGHGVWGPGATLAIMRRNVYGARDLLATDLANCNRYLHGLAAAAQIACPTLLLVARRDRMTPARNVQALQSALRQLTRVDIPDCGHAMMYEQPDRIVDALCAFLGEDVVTKE